MNVTYSIADQVVSTATSIGIYNLSLGYLKAMQENKAVRKITLFGNPTTSSLDLGHPNTEIRNFSYPIRGQAGRIYWDQWGCYREAVRSGNSWLFLPKGFGSIARKCPVKLAVCLADVTSVIYRERYPGSVSAAKHAYYVWTHRQTIRNANIIFTISEFSRQEIMGWAERQRLPCPPVIMAGLAAETDWPQRTKKDQLLVDVRKAPHKRSDLAIAWTERWRAATGYSGSIVAVGTLADTIKIPEHPCWRYLGRVDQETRKNLLAESRALIHFTEHEGYGLPPVESIMAGTPPVYSLIPVTREVMGDTGWPFSNDDEEAFRHALTRALETPAPVIAGWAEDLQRRHRWTDIGQRLVDAMQYYGGGAGE